MIAGIELGGTKTVVAIGTADGSVAEEHRFPTTRPDETFDQIAAWIGQRGSPSAIGIGAFGPVDVVARSPHHGKVLATPKPGWAGFSITRRLARNFPSARLSLETDVNAAALAEARLGAARGIEDLAYITIGTGIGAGLLIGGRLVHGALHPEFGHLKVPLKPGDPFPGICPFHGDCLEGMASGPSIAERWGEPAADLPPDHAAWETEAWYLAHGTLALLSIAVPERVIIGGGVSQAGGFHARVESMLGEIAAGYFPVLEQRPYVVPPLLGQKAGIIGALLLASDR